MKNTHHVIPLKVYLTVATALLLLTIITVSASYIDLGKFNVFIALFIATIKALLVAFFFMHLYYDNKLYFFIFASSVFFLTVLISITMFDTLRRGDIYEFRENPITEQAVIYSNSESTGYSSANSEEFLVGRAVFETSCMECHSIIGQNGISAPFSGLDEEFIFEFIDRIDYTRWIMSPFDGTEGERRELARYLHSKTDQSVTLKTGKEIFDKRCGYCHTINGDTQPIYDSFYGATYEDIIDLVVFLPDQIWFMVPWLGSDEELNKLAEYIQSWYAEENSN